MFQVFWSTSPGRFHGQLVKCPIFLGWKHSTYLAWQNVQTFDLSNEHTPRCLGYIGDYTTQLCGDYKKAFFRIPIKTTSKMKSTSRSYFFCVAHLYPKGSTFFGTLTSTGRHPKFPHQNLHREDQHTMKSSTAWLVHRNGKTSRWLRGC